MKPTLASWPRAIVLIVLAVCLPVLSSAANFTRGTTTATRFGLHEIALTGNGAVANPYDTIATVTFTPPSGSGNAVTVHAFYDGGNTWRARAYVSETGTWTWSSSSGTDSGLNAKSGSFSATTSSLRGKLKKHPADPKAWATDDNQWFLNVSDTAYYLFNPAITSWQQFVTDNWNLGVTSLRSNLAGALRQFEKQQPSDGWDRIFADGTRNTLNLSALQTDDARLEWMLNTYPHLYVQLIVTPEPNRGWGQDENFWAGLSSTQRTRFLHNVVARYAAWPQLFWLVTNDAFHGSGFPNNNAMATEIGTYLAANDPWKLKALRSSGRNRDQPFYFTSAAWVNYVHLETTTALSANQVASYAATPMHVFNGEDWYEDERNIPNDAYFFRRLFWAWTLSGASANYGGYWRTIVPYSQTSFTGLDDAIHIKTFFTSQQIALAGWVPDDARASGPTDTKRVKLMRTADSSAFVFYHPHAGTDGGTASVASGTASLTINNLAAGTYALTWMRADTGALLNAANFTHTGGNRALTAPWAGIDVIAHLRLSGSTPPPPPPGALLGHYSFNETAGTITNHGSTGASLNLTNTGGAAGRDNVGAGGYGAPGHTGYGTAFDVLASGDGTYHSASSGSSLGGGLLTAGAVPQSSLQGSDGAFTYEAFVALSTTTGEQTILSHDGSSTRGFHFHLNGNQLRFYTGATTLTAPIPTSGTHAFAANQWFHVALTYNGQQGVTNNTRFYWTALTAPVTEANLVGTATLAADLAPGVNNVLGVGTTTRSSFRFELRGLVDEVRLTSSAVGAAQFAFLSGGTTPPPGPSVTLTTSDTWDQTSFTSGARWSDGQVPHAGASYVVDGLDVRTPGNTSSHTFGGDSLLLMDGGALVMRTTSPGVITIADFRAEGGAISLAVNGAATLAGELTLQSDGIEVRTNTTTRTLTIQSRITGTGGLVIATSNLNNHVTLTHTANTYSGGTTITSGLLRAHADNALGTGTIIIANGAALHLAQGSTHNYIHDTATVIVGASATLHLGFTGTDTVSSLSLDGGATYVPNGQWGAVGSGAANTSARLTGTGSLQVSGTAN